MSTIEWALLELLMSADPTAHLSVVVGMATVLVVFAAAGVAIAHSALRATRFGYALAVPSHPVRALRDVSPPRPDNSRVPMSGRPGARAPGRIVRRSPSTI